MQTNAHTNDSNPQVQIPFRHDWVRRFYECIFDPTILLLSGRFSDLNVVGRMMGDEKIYWTSETREVTYITMLMGFLYNRASTLLTHISVMVAMLTVIAAQDKIGLLYFICVSFGIFVYLIIAIALIRCLRDIGLDKTYISQDEYEKNTLKELGFRFSLIRFSNVSAILATVGFVIVSFLYFLLRHL
jgi:hypothetical protein